MRSDSLANCDSIRMRGPNPMPYSLRVTPHGPGIGSQGGQHKHPPANRRTHDTPGGSARFAVFSAQLSNVQPDQSKLINLYPDAKTSSTPDIPANPDWNLKIEAEVHDTNGSVTTLLAQPQADMVIENTRTCAANPGNISARRQTQRQHHIHATPIHPLPPCTLAQGAEDGSSAEPLARVQHNMLYLMASKADWNYDLSLNMQQRNIFKPASQEISNGIIKTRANHPRRMFHQRAPQ